jgi:hypothetical protein
MTDKRDTQRAFLESLHGGGSVIPGLPPIVVAQAPDHREPLTPSEPRPPEFQPPFEEVD